MATGGAWRNISVTPAISEDLQAIESRAPSIRYPVFPIREADYSVMRQQYFGAGYQPYQRYQPETDVSHDFDELGFPAPQVVPIETIRTSPVGSKNSVIRGAVTLTSPLYVQDLTGSIAIQLKGSKELNLGDEVEIIGRKDGNGFTPHFLGDAARLLWDRTLVVPVSITSTQAASGVFDASLVEVRGTLRSKRIDRNGSITLELYDAAQIFNAVVHAGLSTEEYEMLEPGSELAIRGICTVLPPSPQGEVAFSVLMRAMDDIQVLAGPPWWNGDRLIQVALALFALIGVGVYLFTRLERWKMHAIISERERLAHEMHDTLAQSFAGVGYHLQGLRNSMQTGTVTQSDVMEMLGRACDMVSHSHREASACIAALHPEADEGGDFLIALDRCARDMLDSDRRNDRTIPVRFAREGVPRPLSIPMRDALFHIGRESITNMLRHAQATEMRVTLRYESRCVVLEILDNGGGFANNDETAGFGIRSMCRRASKVGAQLIIKSVPGEGTRVTAQAPYKFGLKFTDWVRSLKIRLPSRAT
jgi:signal transduction histidine kinase